MSWAADLKMLAAKGVDDLETLAQGVKIEIFSGVVMDTRVDTGRLRGNWNIQESTPDLSTSESIDKSGDKGLKKAAKATPDGLTYFTNNLPYAKVYEDEDAMVALNVARVERNVKEQARKLRR